ncbi:MAG: hypothetical protein WCI89_01270 [bacterium]
MHTHVRRGSMLQLVAPMTAKRFAMAIIMPNTNPPITTARMARTYRDEILKTTRCYTWEFEPLMTLYLTDKLNPRSVTELIRGVKYYPRGLTTNSDSGVQNPASLWTKNTGPHSVLRACADKGKVLMLHAADGFAREHAMVDGSTYMPGEELDPYHQEPHFIRNTLPRIREAHPDLKISVEHLSTMSGVNYMREHGGPTLGCSITAQHLLLDRRDVHRGGLRPHTFWWPIIQKKEDRQAIRELAAGNHDFVWLGSDSAPHPISKKETDCCSGGVLTAHAGIELYAQAFEDMGALDDRFERFASINGPNFFNVKPSKQTIGLVRRAWRVESMFITDDGESPTIHPFMLGEEIRWKLQR